MLPHCVCTEAVITLVKHCLKLGLLPVHKERNLKFHVLSRESSEDHPCGRGYHISRGQLSAFQFRNTTFGDLYLKRRAEQRIACVVFTYLGAGGVWQEGASEPGHWGCVLMTVRHEPKEGSYLNVLKWSCFSLPVCLPFPFPFFSIQF